MVFSQFNDNCLNSTYMYFKFLLNILQCKYSPNDFLMVSKLINEGSTLKGKQLTYFTEAGLLLLWQTDYLTYDDNWQLWYVKETATVFPGREKNVWHTCLTVIVSHTFILMRRYRIFKHNIARNIFIIFICSLCTLYLQMTNMRTGR